MQLILAAYLAISATATAALRLRRQAPALLLGLGLIVVPWLPELTELGGHVWILKTSSLKSQISSIRGALCTNVQPLFLGWHYYWRAALISSDGGLGLAAGWPGLSKSRNQTGWMPQVGFNQPSGSLAYYSSFVDRLQGDSNAQCVLCLLFSSRYCSKVCGTRGMIFYDRQKEF